MSESTYRTLVAWQRAMTLAVEVYTFSKTFPADERFSLTQQIRRCAVSIPSNIAEGRGRGSARDYRRFLHQARGSFYEMEKHVELSERLGYGRPEAAELIMTRISEAARPLNGLIANLDRTLGDS
jgi:four helix bundle protein